VNNDAGLIYPGLFGRARLLGKSNYDALLVPESAINTDQDKKYVYIVDESDKIQRRYVQVGNLLDNNFIVVANGLEQKDHVVVNGIQRIRQSNQQVIPNMTELTWTTIETLVITPETPQANADKGE
jgi:multidrug efflux pump subunit AcrA (membrane-fusion protein)